MGRFWSLLFLAVPVLGVATFVVAAQTDNYWLPKDVSAHGGTIDGLFMFILYLTGAVFIGTGLTLFWFLWKYDGTKNAEPVRFTHGSHVLEVVWSILPAVTLLFIAIYQMDAWAAARMRRPTIMVEGQEIPKPPLAKVVGRMYEWRIQYAGEDRTLDTPDDIHTVNELHVPMDEEVVLQIESEDVLHSFFLPNMRLKQDVVPGKKQFVWFRAVDDGKYDIVCAELCGWGHYKMKGRIVIHRTRSGFDQAMAKLKADKRAVKLPPEALEGGG